MILANLKQSKKRILISIRNRNINIKCKSSIKNLIKKTLYYINKKDLFQSKEFMAKTISILDKYSVKKIIHKNKAARYKSRLLSKINSIV